MGDVVAANAIALKTANNKIYNIGTGIETDVNVLFNKIKDAMGRDVPEVHGEAKAGEQLRSVLDNSLIQKEQGWKPSVSLGEGLKMTVEFFKRKFEE